MKPAYARLFVFLARQAPVGLVVRHGTAKSVCTLRWDREKDKFTLGQWMRGRIDVDFSDLSPDGSLFLYHASRYVYSRKTGLRSHVIDRSFDWTCISRTPYLKAMSYYEGRWGGWFEDDHTFCSPGEERETDREWKRLRRVEGHWPKKPPPRDLRWIRDGWSACARFNDAFERPALAGWALWKSRHRDGFVLRRDGVEIEQREWEWAGVDGRRLVWTARGCLWAGALGEKGLRGEKLLHDFNGMTFQQIAAPYEDSPDAPRYDPAGRSAKPKPKRPARVRVRDEDE